MEYRRNEVTRMLHSNEEAIDDNEGPKAPPGFELFEVPVELDNMKIDEEESVTNLEEVELAREKALDSQLWIRVGRNERYWRQLSKCKLLKEGDRNIRYFHTLAMIKRRKRHIQQVQLNGSIVADPNEIELHIISNLRTLYKRQQVVQPDVSTLQLKRISTQQSQQLEEEVSHSQIRDVAGDCEPSMAPGHDGALSSSQSQLMTLARQSLRRPSGLNPSKVDCFVQSAQLR
ncbi:hypothetical protein Cgig2_029779 [Carnegiea gigantea]|uniref:Uncharacterized protein n=1 Tax=Carnegiea gigantea TaxID=171969 RepID=A0A9Q1KK55_9CARY|nr:hypothetical protein Cgig2_029779 [Carnegiea gigantea]